MLDRLKLAAALQGITHKLFPDLTDIKALAWRVYQSIATDETFVERAEQAQSSFLVPQWRGNLCDVHTVPHAPASYTVVAVDGSQIYPDRHVGGAGCFLINVGTVIIHYGSQSAITLRSRPEVCLPDEVLALGESVPFSVDLVDLLREERELATTVAALQEVQENNPVGLIDGTIIFWNLEGKPPEVRRIFLQRYIAHLQALYEQKFVCAGYISLPKSRELINLVKLGLCRFTTANCIPCHATYDTFPCKQVDALIDTHIAHALLKPGQRTTLFSSSSSIVSEYPVHLRPLFCYLHTGPEIIRLELPAWVADDETYLNRVCQVALDQSRKGRGYPVCLSEAHEQAVVKGADREFFYRLLEKIGITSQRALTHSQKSIKKRGIGI